MTVAVLGTVVTGILFITAGVLAQLANIGFGLWWAELFVFLGVPYVGLRLAGYDAPRTAGLGRPWLGGVVIGFAAGAINFFALVVPLQVLSQKLAPKALLELFDVSGIFKQQTQVELALVLGGVCLAAPFCEEFFFRGLMQRGAEKAFGPGRALIVTAVVFSAFHMDPIGFLARVELGLLFGWLMLRSGSVWPGIFAHFANNSISVGLYFASKGGSEEGDLAWWVPSVMLLIGVPLLAVALRLGQRWLSAPVRADDVPGPGARAPALIAAWIGAGILAFGVLFAVDARGVQLNLVDALTPLKEPKPADGDQAKQSWESLSALRKEVRRGQASVEEYQLARKAAIADRDTTKVKKIDFQF